MATLNLSVTIADADMPRLLAAARGVFGENATEAEITEAIRQHGIQLMKQMVRNHERKAAITAAEALDPQIEVS